jgi:hypothetical protein
MPKEIVDRIEQVRKCIAVTKTEFSEILGYDGLQEYNDFETGKTPLTIEMLQALKKFLPSISANFILWGYGSMIITENVNIDNKIINGDNNQTTFSGSINYNSHPDFALYDKKK